MNLQPEIKILLSEEAREFILSLPKEASKKIYYNIDKVRHGYIDKEIFKKLVGTNYWEFRTLYNKKYYRLLAFWDKNEQSLIIACNGFLKKTDKTPSNEINKANEIRKRYYAAKER